MKIKLLSLSIAALLLMSGCSNSADNSVTVPPSEETAGLTEATTQTSTSVPEEVIEMIPERIYPDNTFNDVPKEYIKNEEVPQGSVVRFEYETSNALDFSEDKKTYQKSALVYLPAGYD